MVMGPVPSNPTMRARSKRMTRRTRRERRGRVWLRRHGRVIAIATLTPRTTGHAPRSSRTTSSMTDAETTTPTSSQAGQVPAGCCEGRGSDRSDRGQPGVERREATPDGSSRKDEIGTGPSAAAIGPPGGCLARPGPSW
jgi:hypothetical protein